MDALEILERLCLQPTVSYHEWRVAREISSILNDYEINVRRDRWGNVIAEINGDESKPPLVFVAPYGPSGVRSDRGGGGE